jgi:hypothetical protein
MGGLIGARNARIINQNVNLSPLLLDLVKDHLHFCRLGDI